MVTKNDKETVLNKIYKNAHLALQSISNLMDECDDEPMKKELQREYEGYEKAIGEISSKMKDLGIEGKEPNVFKKAMMWTSIKISALKDDTSSHFAEMMVQGTVMGITELIALIKDTEQTIDEDVLVLAKNLLSLEEGYEETLKKFL